MFKQLLAPLLVLCFLSFNVVAKSDNPFAKKDSLTVGKDVSWQIDKKAVLATKTSSDGKGTFYHLQFDNKQLKLSISSDANGANPKKFGQLEVKDIAIDGTQVPLFKWCLNNQDRHNRFLQQGLKVKKNICSINGNAGTLIIRLNRDTLDSLQSGNRLTFMLKPFRTQLELKYDISDFKDMIIALNAKPAKVVVAPVAKKTEQNKPARKCWAGAPPQYNNIKSVEYNCDDAAAKTDAELWVSKLVNKEKDKEKKRAAEKEKQRKRAEEKKQKELVELARQEELLAAETAAVAASQAKQAEIGSEITEKMVNVCKKYWDKGEHRCYCQKYIEYAPSSIQASSTCD